MGSCASYLVVLQQLTDVLEQLSVSGRKKLSAVQRDDLNELNQILMQEQALSLTVRSLEHKRQTEYEALAAVPLSELEAQYPEAMRPEARKVIGDLRTQYRIYQSVSTVARDALECGLHEIEKVLNSETGTGYAANDVELPKQLRTDIRA